MEYNVEKCRTKELYENKSTHFLGFKNIAHKVAQKLLAGFTNRMRY